MVLIRTMKTLAARLRWAREKRGLSCAELDEVADLTLGHTASVESKRIEVPSTATASKLARALDVEVGWLIEGGKAPQIAKAG